MIRQQQGRLGRPHLVDELRCPLTGFFRVYFHSYFGSIGEFPVVDRSESALSDFLLVSFRGTLHLSQRETSGLVHVTSCRSPTAN